MRQRQTFLEKVIRHEQTTQIWKPFTCANETNPITKHVSHTHTQMLALPPADHLSLVIRSVPPLAHSQLTAKCSIYFILFLFCPENCSAVRKSWEPKCHNLQLWVFLSGRDNNRWRGHLSTWTPDHAVTGPVCEIQVCVKVSCPPQI